MPFLRFARDRRGYESTYLVHTYRSGRETVSQVLYWFRTPPHVKVGRPALDEATMRTIEQAYPDLSFDWENLLKQRRPPPPEFEQRGSGRRRAAAEPVRKRRMGTTKSTATRSVSMAATKPDREAAAADVPATAAADESLGRRSGLDGVDARPESAESGAARVGETDTPADGPARRRRRSRRGGVRRTRRRKRPADTSPEGGEAATAPSPEQSMSAETSDAGQTDPT